jgi:hypothetical protein
MSATATNVFEFLGEDNESFGFGQENVPQL